MLTLFVSPSLLLHLIEHDGCTTSQVLMLRTGLLKLPLHTLQVSYECCKKLSARLADSLRFLYLALNIVGVVSGGLPVIPKDLLVGLSSSLFAGFAMGELAL